ncbi:MAG: DNA repair protein RecO [Desulfuromonas sp.]|nr:MAG: DNA repair protein RecO [Desulfuromonas sp.]
MGALPQRTEAVVLRTTNYSEADRIVTLLTADQGLRKGFAKAARNSRKRFSGGLEPFTRAIFHWREGRGTLWSLQDAELLDGHYGLRDDIRRLALAGYGVELVELLLEEGEPQPAVYSMVCAFLAYLATGGDPAVARLLLELRLVNDLGYIPHLLHCSECFRVFHQESIRFDTARGGCLCLACAGGSGFEISLGTAGSLARTLKVESDRFAGFQFGELTLHEGQKILSQVLRSILPREPKSLRFLAQL